MQYRQGLRNSLRQLLRARNTSLYNVGLEGVLVFIFIIVIQL